MRAAPLVIGAALLVRPALAGAPAPAPAKAAKLEARPMLGPFAQIDDFCRSLRKAGLLDCANTGASPRSAVSARGVGVNRIQAARLVPLRRAGKTARPVDVAIAMRVAAGWFVDPGRAPDRAKRTDDVRIDRAKATIKWSDGLGAGILNVAVEREGEVHRITRSGADTEEWTTDRNEWDERYCGMGASGVPSCTDELVTGCNGSLVGSHGYFRASISPQPDTGRLAVAVQSGNASSCTIGLVPTEESYELPFAGVRRPTKRWFAEFNGPFASIESHCREMQEPADGRCVMAPGRWNRRVKPLGARGRVRGVRLFRVRTSHAGVPVESCRIAVATADGWYVDLEGQDCQGDFGSMVRRTEARTLAWADGTPDPAFVITVHHGEDHQAFLPGKQRPVGMDSEETERARLCTVPADGPPRCGPEHVVACQDREHRWRKAALTVTNGALAAPPGPKVECDSGAVLGAAILTGEDLRP
jgi:hypothetical protein